MDLVKDEKLDLLIIEGFHSLAAKRQNIFKIITAKNEEDLRRTLEGTVEPILAVTGVITQQKLVLSEISTPIIDLKDQGEKIIELVKSKVLDFLF